MSGQIGSRDICIDDDENDRPSDKRPQSEHIRDYVSSGSYTDVSSSSLATSVDLQLHSAVMEVIRPHTLLNGSILSLTTPTVLPKVDTISSRRGFEFSLSQLINLPSPTTQDSSDKIDTKLTRNGELQRLDSQGYLHERSAGQHTFSRPLTPPQDSEPLLWLGQASRGVGAGDVVTNGGDSQAPSVPENASQSVQDNSINNVPSTPSTLQFGSETWFRRALAIACHAPDLDSRSGSTKVISQVLPTNAYDQRAIKTYEMVCEHLQTILPEPQYISITHALTVSPGQTVEDFPKSPPVTPNHTGRDDYFGDQTMFTHAAQVPAHHELSNMSTTALAVPQRHVMLAEANLVVLERYIPPTTSREAKHFFNPNSMTSYLADRLPELTLNHGSLVLIYPTKTGAATFLRHYVGPVLDPLLREMTILKGLNTNAAERLGKVDSVEAMDEFEDMKRLLDQFCGSMNARQTIRRTKSEFSVVHSHKTEVVLDRETWMTWFIEQEQGRMKQNLVDYHRAGGKLPNAEGSNTEVTAGMLAREVAEGFKNSKHEAGDVGIEIGVFVLRRAKLVG